jgi:uncharacterized membrane protein YfcA
MISTEVLLAGGAIFFAYLVRGVSGFGSALIAVPLLVHLYALTWVVPLVTVLDVIAALILTGAGQRGGHVRWREVAWLMPPSLLGIALGLQLLVSLDARWLLATLGVFVVAFGVRSLLGLQPQRIVSRLWAIPAGLLGGGIGAVFSTGGPPFVIYLGHRLGDKAALRATLSAVFLADGGLRVAGLLLAGLLWQGQMAWALLGALPMMLAGLVIGHRIHTGLSRAQMVRVVGLLLLASGLSLLYRVYLGG